MHELNIGLIVSFIVAVVVDVAAPVLMALWIARHYKGTWRLWFYGLLVFAVFQGLTRVPAMIFIQSRPAVAEALQQPAYFWLFLLFAAFTAGLFEEGGRWLALRYFVKPEQRTWRNALMFGAGHGGLESIAVGLLALAGLVGYLALTLLPAESLPIPGEQLAQAKEQFTTMQGWEPLMGGWERLMALALQISFAVMVQHSFVHGSRWWWYALAAHTWVDFTVVGCLRVTTEQLGSSTAMLLTEGLLTIYALLALWAIRELGKRSAAGPR